MSKFKFHIILTFFFPFLLGIEVAHAGGGSAGDDCANPEVILSTPYSQNNLTTCGAVNDYTSTDACGSLYMGGEDFVFEYTPSVDENVSVTLTNTDTWTGVFVLDDCPDAGAGCIAQNTSSGGNPSIGAVALNAGQTYYIVVSTFPLPDCTPFNISINPVVPTCSDGILNQGELGVDCGGPCPACPVPNVQDCGGAIPICQDTYFENDAYSGTGNVLNEINSDPSCLGSGEKNDVWYVFTVQSAGNLCFTITPNVLSDDYDWAVYDLTTDPCSDIYTNSSLEVSCNYSGTPGETGPNGVAGDQNEPCVPVNVGETYVINVSQYSTSTNGYTIDFSASTAQIFDNVAPTIANVDTPIVCGQTSLSFWFSENVLCSSVQSSDFTLSGPGGPYTITGVSGTGCILGADYEDYFTVDLSNPLTMNGNYTLNLVGSVEDNCGNVVPNGSLPFTINNCIAVQCTSTTVQALTIENCCPPFTISTVPVNTSCNGSCDGSVNLTVSGGTAPYTFSWSNGSNLEDPANFCAGLQTVTITDDNGCDTVVNVTINSGPSLTANFTYNGNQCVGNSFNFTNTSIPAGNSWSWTFPGGSPATSSVQNPSGITWGSPGTYNVTLATTFGSCTDNQTITITVYDPPTASIAGTNETCPSACDGIANLTVVVGDAPITNYSWSNGASTEDISGLCPNIYNVTVTDANGCTATANVTIGVGTGPTAGFSVNDPDQCLTGNSFVFTNTGDAPGSCGMNCPTFIYDFGDGSPPISGTKAVDANPSYTYTSCGTYTVTLVVDNATCTDTATQDVEIFCEPTASIVGTDVSCVGACDGAANLTVSDGTAPYTYLWSPGGQTIEDITNLCANTYDVVVTDANGCTTTANITITQPSVLSGSITSQTNILCNGGNNGSVTVSGVNGTPGYQYSLDGGPYQGSGTFPGLSAGSYTVTVMDAKSCTVDVPVTITQPSAVTGSITSQTNVLCNGGSTGSVTVAGANGTPGYQYSLDGGPYLGSGTFSGLSAGSYTVTVRDANGCTVNVPV
ncbi:MAG: PKD domain-containing protein, partial [Bacteroidota bacterium]